MADRGLEPYAVNIIKNSRWIAEQEKINAYHLGYNREHWREYKHYLFAFHDEVFECIAKGYDVDVYKGSICDLMKIAYENLFS